MPNPHPPSRSPAPTALTFVAAPAPGPRARGRRAVAPRYDRLAIAFPHLPAPLLVELAQGVEETFLPGETIVREGDPADRFYIIESGQAEGTPSRQHADMRVVTMKAGDYFGEVGLLANRTRTATVRAVSEVRVVSLDRAQFQVLVNASQANAQKLGALGDHPSRALIPLRTRSRPASRDASTDPRGQPASRSHE